MLRSYSHLRISKKLIKASTLLVHSTPMVVNSVTQRKWTSQKFLTKVFENSYLC